ncbi:MAG: chloride channel protein [Rhodobacteraceae bacterium]|nr:chloride channel protein [Paracoccaceae bacterium]
MVQGSKSLISIDGGSIKRITALSLCAIVIGLVSALAAIAFVDAVGLLNRILLISPRARVQYESIPYLVEAATLLVPTAGGLVVGLLLLRVSPERRPVGPAEVIKSTQLGTPLPDLRTGLVSTAAAILSLGAGASVGQFGPVVYLGALVGNFARKLQIDVKALPTMAVACGVAAAMSAAFNAPIAGLVFAHEVVLRHYSLRAFSLTTIAAAMGYVVTNIIFDRPALFLVSFEGVGFGHEFALFALLGALSAVIAMALMKLVMFSGRIAASLPVFPPLRTACAGLAVGLTALWLPDVLGIGSAALRFATIEGAFEANELLVLVVAKIVLTAICLGFGFAGGIFSPSLLIGIMFGAFFWSVLDSTQSIANSGVVAYAICGMMAIASPVMGAPLTVILIVFELTRNYDLTIGAMVAVVASNLISFRIFGRSLFDVVLKKQGIDLSQGREFARLAAVRVVEYANDDFPRAQEDVTAGELRHRLTSGKWNEAFVENSEGQFLGKIYGRDLHADSASTSRDVLHSAGLVYSEKTTIFQAMQSLADFVGDAVPIVDSKTGKLLGVVTESAIIVAYLELVHDIRREEHAPV